MASNFHAEVSRTGAQSSEPSAPSEWIERLKPMPSVLKFPLSHAGLVLIVRNPISGVSVGPTRTRSRRRCGDHDEESGAVAQKASRGKYCERMLTAERGEVIATGS